MSGQRFKQIIEDGIMESSGGTVQEHKVSLDCRERKLKEVQVCAFSKIFLIIVAPGEGLGLVL